jgi:hypothetical protein
VAAIVGGILAGRWSVPERSPSQGPSITKTVAAQSEPSVSFPVKSNPVHVDFEAALNETDPYQRMLSLTAILSTCNPSKFPNWVKILQDAGDESALTLLVDAWQRRDMPGLVTVLPDLPTWRLVRIVKQAASNGATLPVVLADALASLSLVDRVNVSHLLIALSDIDAELAQTLSQSAPRTVREGFENRQYRELLEKDPEQILTARGENYSTDQRTQALGALAQRDLARALDYVLLEENPRIRMKLQTALVPAWANEDHEAALSWVTENLGYIRYSQRAVIA